MASTAGIEMQEVTCLLTGLSTYVMASEVAPGPDQDELNTIESVIETLWAARQVSFDSG